MIRKEAYASFLHLLDQILGYFRVIRLKARHRWPRMMGEKHDVRLTAAQDLPDNARVSERRSVDLADLRVEVELQPLFWKNVSYSVRLELFLKSIVNELRGKKSCFCHCTPPEIGHRDAGRSGIRYTTIK